MLPLQAISLVRTMNYELTNARILTMTPGEEIFWGDVIIEGNIIKKVIRRDKNSAEKNSPTTAETTVINCHGNLLMPGFKNAHTHSGMSLLRSLADDLPLDKWLNESIFPIEAKMTGEDIYWASQLSILEYLTSGITACFDMYLDAKEMAQAADDMGFRCVQTSGANDYSSNIYAQSGFYDLINNKEKGYFSDLQSYILGYHAEYTTSLENHKKILEQIHQKQSPCYVHACETASEVAGCRERYGMSPLQFMDSMGLFDYGGGIYHGVHMSEEDYEVMSRRGLYVVTNPGSNTKLASGIAPITEYLRRGIPVAIGTDGPASNNALDFFREMFLVTGLAKLREQDASAVDAREVLTMATVNGAKAMHLDDCQTLSEGQKADIIMIDLMQPNMQPLNNIAKNIVYAGTKQNVTMTMIDGKILYQDGKFADSIDVSGIYKHIEESQKRLGLI